MVGKTYRGLILRVTSSSWGRFSEYGDDIWEPAPALAGNQAGFEAPSDDEDSDNSSSDASNLENLFAGLR